MAIARKLAIVLSMLLLQGCLFGAYIMHPKTDDSVANRMVFASCQQFHERWGEPDSVKADSNKTVLDYTRGFDWAGLAVTIWGPTLPIGVPVGLRHIVVSCYDDKLINVTTTQLNLVGFTCAWWDKFRCGFGQRQSYGVLDRRF